MIAGVRSRRSNFFRLELQENKGVSANHVLILSPQKADNAGQTLIHSSQLLVSFRYEGNRTLCSRLPGRFLYFPSICSARENAVIMIVKEIHLLLSAFLKQLKASVYTLILKSIK